jgi:drug/metabolite transporter (DMT)-like permease
MKNGEIIATVAAVSLFAYTASYSRRLLAKDHDERFIVMLEVLLIFLITTGILFVITDKQTIVKSVEKFKPKHLKLVLMSALSISVLSLLWIHVINSNELSKLQMFRRGFDLIFAIGGGYLLFKEDITPRKLGAFSLLIISVYLLSY